MKPFLSRTLSDDAEVRRIELLYERLPSAVVAALIGILLCFAVLFETIGLDVLKAWTAYMLSILAVRVWTWYMFGRADRQATQMRRWEGLFAAGAFFSGLGWGSLFGPLYPTAAHLDLQVFVFLLAVVVSFNGAVFLAASNATFWLFTVPIMLPAIIHYTDAMNRRPSWTVVAAVGCVAVLILIQRTLYASATQNLRRSTQAESLLAEQEAIFDSSPLGIAVIESKHIVKCNARLAELLGRRLGELAGARIEDHFASAGEAGQFLVDSAGAFDRGLLAQGMYRLRRADGSQFWAEFSGRKMAGGTTHGVWMIADVTLRVARERQGQGCDPA
ncbi:MAG: PAS domain-containing protein [Rhodocyclales bacterium]|jgi:PAS domain S-box-containing protein|nr:PAS domain-containing protein [Rhodocyclales bacterium]